MTRRRSHRGKSRCGAPQPPIEAISDSRLWWNSSPRRPLAAPPCEKPAATTVAPSPAASRAPWRPRSLPETSTATSTPWPMFNSRVLRPTAGPPGRAGTRLRPGAREAPVVAANLDSYVHAVPHVQLADLEADGRLAGRVEHVAGPELGGQLAPGRVGGRGRQG